MTNKNLTYNPVDGDFEIVTNREWLATLSDEEFAKEVLDVTRCVCTDFTGKTLKVAFKNQERSFANWLKAQKVYWAKNTEGK